MIVRRAVYDFSDVHVILLMRQRSYSGRPSTAALATSGTLGILISLPVPLVVLSGIYGGLFTLPEGAAVGTFGTLIAGLAGCKLTLADIGRSVLGGHPQSL